MHRFRWIVSGLALLGLLALGCGDENSGGTSGTGDGHPPAEMVATWLFQSVTVDGGAADLADVMDWVPGAVSAEIDIQANGAYVFSQLDGGGGQLFFESGFVYVDGDEIDINVQQDSDGSVNETDYATYTLAGDSMTLTQTDGGATVVFTLMK